MRKFKLIFSLQFIFCSTFSSCKVVENVEQIKNVIEQATSLDKTLYWMVSHLRNCSGEILLDTISTFNNCLQNFTAFVKQDAGAAQPYLDKYLELGNPKFLEVELSDFQIKFLMKWKDAGVDRYHTLCVRAYNHWVDLMFLHDNFTKFV